MMRAPLVILLVSVVAGCRGQTSPPPAASRASPGSPAPSEAASVQAPKPPPRALPPDLDLAPLTKALGCGTGKAKRKACDVLREFEGAGRFTGDTPSGDSRWFGQAYVVEKGSERAEFVSLVSRRVPTARVGVNDLPLMLSMAPMPEDRPSEAAKLWKTMSQSSRHRGSKKNLAFRHVESYVPTGERGAINTTGPSVQSIVELSEDVAYLRQPQLKKLLVVRPARGGKAEAGDGTYAELWQAVW
jgi:hypothetical protein